MLSKTSAPTHLSLLALAACLVLPDLQAQSDLGHNSVANLFPASDYELALPQGGEKKVETGPKWEGSLTLGAMFSAGNTKRRNANMAAEAKRTHGKHRTTGTAAWNFAQQKADGDPNYQVDQRHTEIALKHDYFFAKKTYAFLATDAVYDYDQDIALRHTVTAGVGFQVLDEADKKWSVEVGAGYYKEDSRTPGVPTDEHPAGRVSWDFKWTIKKGLQFFNLLKCYPSLEDADDISGTLDSRLRSTLTENMFAQLQWIMDYDNTPPIDGMGNLNDRVDHRVFLSVGWTF